MEKDFGLAEFFASVPNAIKRLLAVRDAVTYRMVSPELKRVERRLDACFIPVDAPDKPLLAVEFQGYPDKGIYYKALAKGALLGEKFPDYGMTVVILFLNQALDPKTVDWHDLGRSGFSSFRVIYLAEAVARMEQENPNDPTAALLGLLVQPKEEVEAEDARRRYGVINEAAISREEKQVYVKLLVYWLMQLLSSTEEEMIAMIGIMTPLEETPAYKSIFAKGRFGQVLDQISRVEKRYREGQLSEESYQSLIQLLRSDLEDLRNTTGLG